MTRSVHLPRAPDMVEWTERMPDGALPEVARMILMLVVVLVAWLGASLPFGLLMGRALRRAQVHTPAPQRTLV